MASYNDTYSKLDWALKFQRTGSFPLDRTDLFSSLTDAIKYAAGNIDDPDSRNLCGTSYVGQIITVFENDIVKAYVIKADRTLEDIGSGVSLTDYYTKAQTDAVLSGKANVGHLHPEILSVPSGGSEGQVLKKTPEGYAWGTDNVGSSITIDNEPTNDSSNPVSSGGVYTALEGKVSFSDLTESMSGKVNTVDLASVATSGAYADLLGKPTIPDSTSDLTNDSGFIVADVSAITPSSSVSYQTQIDNINTTLGNINTVLSSVVGGVS